MPDLPLKRLGLLTVLVLVATGVYLSISASSKAYSIHGPSLIREDFNKDIWIWVTPWLFRLSPEGAEREAISLEDLGFRNGIEDFLPLPSGDLLIGDRKTKEIKRYSPARELRHAFSLGETAEYRTFKFAFESRFGDIFVADTHNHRVLRFDRESRPLGSFGSKGDAKGAFHFPNAISIGPYGLLYIADTNNHRIVIRELDGGLRSSIKTAGPEEKRTDNIWPTHFSFASEKLLFVVNKGSGLEGGDILSIDRATGRTINLKLPTGADPMEIVARPGDLLVADAGRMEISRLTHEGISIGTFGDSEKLRQVLSDRLAKRERLRLTARFVMIERGHSMTVRRGEIWLADLNPTLCAVYNGHCLKRARRLTVCLRFASLAQMPCV